ncbi:MAG: A/G-specific adenine glycosylase [Planctomycetota bacterium]|nr:A/G-specific adenine glycosylase [Planctomycetota bacterium]
MSAGFAARLLAWYDAHGRTLPWRRSTPDPWGTWVSEVMLQQTRVEVVREAWARFRDAFPEPVDFAVADDDALHRAWQGLGYYRRARLLRDGARQVVERHGGSVPSGIAELGALAGIGEYTRGAIASIAFGHPVAAIDGNVERVFARHRAVRDDVKKTATRRLLRTLVEAEIDRARPGDFNQALMDLGATVCTPRSPRCGACPLAADCAARSQGLQEELPVLPARRAMVDVAARVVVVRDSHGRVLGARIPTGEINQGQMELPGPGVLVDHPGDAQALAFAIFARHGAQLRIGDELTRVRHGITHHRITVCAYAGELSGEAGDLEFLDPGDPGVPWSTPARKVLAKLDG